MKRQCFVFVGVKNREDVKCFEIDKQTLTSHVGRNYVLPF
jgi:hypothetical protein